MGTYTRHSDEYKAQAVELIRQDGWTYREVAQGADVSIGAVRLWVDKAKKNESGLQVPLTREELEAKTEN
jgi:transposase-like protein